MKNLSGLKGCKKMARQILRQERQAGRDNYVAGQKKDNPLASGVAKPRVRSAAPWTRRYVPGSKESGTTLPEDTTKSGLTCVQREKGKAPCYVALYYNTTLQQKHKKRPTRSKTFHASTSGKGDPKAEHLPEHRAFQITLKWLWARHESCINPAPPRPSWVVEALADCSLCKDGVVCNFMEHIRARKAPGGAVDSEESSMFENEGTSDSMSSDAVVVDRPHKRLRGKQPATSSKAPIGIGGATPRRLKVLLVGDSNAVGYCETLPWDNSLRKQLSTHYNITVAGKSGTGWVKIAENVKRQLEAYCKGETLAKDFDAVFTVLGTNDVPKVTAGEKRWHQLEDAMTQVVNGLKGFLRTSVTGVPIYVTAPFCFEASHATLLFCETLQRVCKDTRSHFVSVPWDETRHVQNKTKTPLKHFNTVGVKLLTESLLGAFPAAAPVMAAPEMPLESMSRSASVAQLAVPSEVMSQSASVADPAEGRQAPAACPKGSWRIPTPSAMTPRVPSSSSSSSRSSSSSSSSRSCNGKAVSIEPGAPSFCEICLTRNHHDTQDCPLVFAAAYGEDADFTKAIVLSLQEAGQPRPLAAARRFPCLLSSSFREILIPSDGNCLFAALAVGRSLQELPSASGGFAERAELGNRCRRDYLDTIAERHRLGQTFAGVDISAALDIGRQWTSVEQYVASMDFPIEHRRQWGGYGEALLLSHEWGRVVAIFGQTAKGEHFLLCEPIRPPGADDKSRICLLWKRTHYDLLVVPDSLWLKAESKD